MKILFVSPFFFYPQVPYAGGRITLDLVKGLTQRHEIHLVSGIEKDQEKYLKDVEPYCKNIEIVPWRKPVATGIYAFLCNTLTYLLVDIKANRIMKGGSFDLVHVEYIETGLFIRNRTGIPMVMHAHDLISKRAGRWFLKSNTRRSKILNYLKWKITEKLESHILIKFDRILIPSLFDKTLLQRLNPNFKIAVISYPILPERNFSDWAIPMEPLSLLFLGAMYREVNVQAALFLCNKILPIIKEKIPDVKLYLVGERPPAKIQKLGRKDKNIIVTGFVEAVEPYYLKCSVFVSPLLVGGGIIIKNIDAMAAGRPVVTTSIGNEGIGTMPDRDILIADEQEEFANKVLMLLQDQGLWEKIASNGQKFVREHFSPDAFIPRIEQTYHELVQKELNGAYCDGAGG